MKYALCLFVALCALECLPAAAAPPLDAKEFQRLHRLIQPKADEEAWLKIPWQANLWEARQQAAQEGKPILLWEMDGHPLGCV